MARGRKRKLDPTIPAHIDQAKIPKGIYWDKTGAGRWYVREPRPEGGTAAPTVAGPKAKLSDLHAIIEQRSGKDAAGTFGYVITQFAASREYAGVSKATRKDYDYCADIVRATKTKLGCTLDALQVDKVPTPAIEKLIEEIAKGTPESRPGVGDAVPASLQRKIICFVTCVAYAPRVFGSVTVRQTPRKA